MNERAPKMPMAASESESGLENAERLERAQEVYEALRQHDGADVYGAPAIAEVEALARELHELLEGENGASPLSWNERVEYGLPWNPRVEVTRAVTAANDPRTPLEQAA